MKKQHKVISKIFAFILASIPSVSFAAIVTCGNTLSDPCNFEKAVDIVNNTINWILGISGVVFTLILIFGGFLWILSGEDPGKRTRAKDMFKNGVMGYVIILVSWLIVYTILKYLVVNYKDSIFKFLGKGY